MPHCASAVHYPSRPRNKGHRHWWVSSLLVILRLSHSFKKKHRRSLKSHFNTKIQEVHCEQSNARSTPAYSWNPTGKNTSKSTSSTSSTSWSHLSLQHVLLPGTSAIPADFSPQSPSIPTVHPAPKRRKTNESQTQLMRPLGRFGIVWTWSNPKNGNHGNPPQTNHPNICNFCMFLFCFLNKSGLEGLSSSAVSNPSSAWSLEILSLILESHQIFSSRRSSEKAFILEPSKN